MFYGYWQQWACAVLAAVFLIGLPTGECRNVTHEDIRDAMLSLVHMFRTSEDKLERHEYREKVLGDQLKKSLIGLEKKHRALEPLKGAISRLDDRLSNVETILMQKEEREKSLQQKNNEALEAIKSSLQTLTASLPKLLKAQSNDVPIENNLTTNEKDTRINILEDNLNRKIDVTNAKLDGIKQDIEVLKKSLSKEALKAMCLELGSKANPLEKHISEAEKLLTKYELKLSEYNTTRVPTDFVPLNEVSLADEAWHNKMTEVMEKQEKEIKKIQQLLQEAAGVWKALPKLTDFSLATNQTLVALSEARYAIVSSDEQATLKVTNKLREISEKTATTNEDIQKSLTEGNTLTERMYGDISKSYVQLHTELQSLSKLEHVMVKTGDIVMDTKKRVDYGVHQIILEMSDLVKTQSKQLNRTLYERFYNIEMSIVNNQTGALANLTTKIEAEMSQVWRQIGTMYQQLTASRTSLDRLQKQTEQYVNGSVSTMDSMENKVGMITSRMALVDENLQYLLGRLSLVTQEFNQIKEGLGDALDNVKTSFLTLQEKVKEAGPVTQEKKEAKVLK